MTRSGAHEAAGNGNADSRMIRAGLTSVSPDWPWRRQFPGGIPVWDGVEFVFERDLAQCDVVFVYGNTLEERPDGLPVKRAIFISGEPPSVKAYRSRYLNQFDRVLTTDPGIRLRNTIHGQPGLPWHVGVRDESGAPLKRAWSVDEFAELRPAKTKLLSVVSSNLTRTRGHRQRLAFVEQLKSAFGDEVDVFGRNIRDFGDKHEVLADYRYHIALENSVYPHYWTEKLADPFLTLTYPIYHGCPNIGDYFPQSAMTPINSQDPESAIKTIRRIINSDLAERSLPALEDARRKVLGTYNLFSVLSRLAHESMRVAPRERRIRPERTFRRDYSAKLRRVFEKFR